MLFMRKKEERENRRILVDAHDVKRVLCCLSDQQDIMDDLSNIDLKMDNCGWESLPMAWCIMMRVTRSTWNSLMLAIEQADIEILPGTTLY